MTIEEDPVLRGFFDTPEKKARWIYRLKIAYLLWIAFAITGIMSLLIWHLLR